VPALFHLGHDPSGRALRSAVTHRKKQPCRRRLLSILALDLSTHSSILSAQGSVILSRSGVGTGSIPAYSGS